MATEFRRESYEIRLGAKSDGQIARVGSRADQPLECRERRRLDGQGALHLYSRFERRHSGSGTDDAEAQLALTV